MARRRPPSCRAGTRRCRECACSCCSAQVRRWAEECMSGELYSCLQLPSFSGFLFGSGDVSLEKYRREGRPKSSTELPPEGFSSMARTSFSGQPTRFQPKGPSQIKPWAHVPQFPTLNLVAPTFHSFTVSDNQHRVNFYFLWHSKVGEYHLLTSLRVCVCVFNMRLRLCRTRIMERENKQNDGILNLSCGIDSYREVSL